MYACDASFNQPAPGRLVRSLRASPRPERITYLLAFSGTNSPCVLYWAQLCIFRKLDDEIRIFYNLNH
jgi:hypothetical protein